MRPVIAVFLVALAHSAFGASVAKAQISPFAFETEIYDIFDCIRVVLGKNYSTVEVPALSLDFDSIQILYVRGFLKLTNLRLTDPSLISLSNLVGTISVLPPAFTIQGTAAAHDLAVETEYEGNITENELHLWGQGTLNAHILDIVIDNIYGRYGLLANPPFTDVRGSLSAGQSQGNITGYKNDENESAIVNDIIKDINTWIQENGGRINGLIGDYLKAVLNGQFTASEPEEGEEEGPSFWDIMEENCPAARREIRI